MNMEQRITFDQLPLRFKLLIRALTACCFGLATYAMAVSGLVLAGIPHLLLNIGFLVGFLYAMVQLLTLVVIVCLMYGGKYLGHGVVFFRRSIHRFSAKAV